MKLLNWNVRGLGNPRTIRRFQHTLKLYKPQLVCIMETKLDHRRMKLVRRKCGFQNGIDLSATGTRGGICLSWNENYLVNVLSYSESHVDAEVSDEDNSNK